MSNNYPSNWDQIRKKIYKRDDYTCQGCGDKNTELHCHHIVPKSQGGGENESNLITLCKSCHEDVHGHQIGGDAQKGGIENLGDYAIAIALMVVLSIMIPPLAIIAIPFAVLCLIALIAETFE